MKSVQKIVILFKVHLSTEHSCKKERGNRSQERKVRDREGGRERERERDRQTDRETDRDRQADKQGEGGSGEGVEHLRRIHGCV